MYRGLVTKPVYRDRLAISTHIGAKMNVGEIFPLTYLKYYYDCSNDANKSKLTTLESTKSIFGWTNKRMTYSNSLSRPKPRRRLRKETGRIYYMV